MFHYKNASGSGSSTPDSQLGVGPWNLLGDFRPPDTINWAYHFQKCSAMPGQW